MWNAFDETHMRRAIHLDQLRQQYTRWSASKQQHSTPDFDLHSFDAMQCARSGLKQHSVKIWKVADRMYQPRRISAVLCAPSWSVPTKGYQVLAMQGLAPRAVKARETWFEGIGYDAVTDRDVRDIRTDSGDSTGCFVAYDLLGSASWHMRLC